MQTEALVLMMEGYASLCTFGYMHILPREVDRFALQATVREGMQASTAAQAPAQGPWPLISNYFGLCLEREFEASSMM